MQTCTCDMCGKKFEARGNTKACPECRVATCVVCGRQKRLEGSALTKYRQRGYWCCSSKCASTKLRRENLEKYGVEFLCQTPEVREKIRAGIAAEPEDVKQARTERIVAVGRDEAVKAKRAATNLERYGSVSPLGLEENRSKGVKAARSDEAKAKRKRTNLERYGVENSYQTEASREAAGYGVMTEMIKEYISENSEASIEQIAHDLGVSYHAVWNQNKKYNLGVKKHQSYLEHVMSDYLESLGAMYIVHDRRTIAPLELDFLAEGTDGRKVAIEVNDVLTHNSTYSPYGEPKPKRYHYEKTLACREKGIPLIHAWEWCMPGSGIESGRIGSWEVLKNRIAHALGMTPNRIGARELRVVEMTPKDAAPFFERNNVNGRRGAKTVFALVGKDVESPTWEDVYMAYAVGDAHLGGRKGGKAKYDAEIARGACRLGWEVMGGASKLWNAITGAKREDGSYRWDSLVYYVDLNFYSAESVSTLPGIEYRGWAPSFWNYWVSENRLKNREPARNAEVKAAREAGFVWEVYGAGTETYVWDRRRLAHRKADGEQAD